MRFLTSRVARETHYRTENVRTCAPGDAFFTPSTAFRAPSTAFFNPDFRDISLNALYGLNRYIGREQRAWTASSSLRSKRDGK
jgi:hypothetical protein